MTKRQPAKGQTPKINYRRSDTFSSHYANDTQIQTGAFDIRILFGTLDKVQEDRTAAEVIQTAEVRMSPQHALLVLKILGDHLRRYEATVGAIPKIEIVS